MIAANASSSDYQIVLPAGTYALTRLVAGEDAALTGDLDVLNNGSVQIVGAGIGSTTIDASGLDYPSRDYGDRILDVQSGAVVAIEGITLTGGNMQGTTPSSISQGGAIRNTGGHVSVTNAALADNTATYGGAIWNSGELHLADATLTSNSTNRHHGGAIYNSATGEVTITASTIADNISSGQGGGIWNSGKLSVADSSLLSNSAQTFDGGAIYNSATGAVTITTSTLADNSGSSGGGISNSGQLSVADSSLLSNSAQTFNGARHLQQGVRSRDGRHQHTDR